MSAERWITIFGGTFLIGALFENSFLATFAALLILLLLFANLWRWHALDGIVYRRKPFYRRGFPGETIELELEVENRKFLPLTWLRIEDPWPASVGPEDEDQLAPSHLADQGLLKNVFSLRWFEKVKRNYTLMFRRRGVYKIGPARMQSGDAFGMYDVSREVGTRDYLTVFPEILPSESLDLSTDDPLGDQRTMRRLFEDPSQTIGVRDYQSGDSFRRIHWTATARTGKLQAREYQPTSAKIVVICLNVSTFEKHWEGVYPELLERLVSIAATLSFDYVQKGYQVGLISNGCLAYSDRTFRIPPSRSPNQLGYLLEALAGVTPLVMVPFDQFLIREMAKVYYGASLLIVSAIHPPELINTLRILKLHSRRITLYSLADEPPPFLPGIGLVHQPFEESIARKQHDGS